MYKSYSLPVSFVICIIVYGLAIVAAYLFLTITDSRLNLLLATFIADVIATIIVFVFSLIFNNASLYDPYWSVAPPLIAWYWFRKFNGDILSTISIAIVFTAIWIWAIRLTLNWARGWKGLAHEDWRYVMLREKNPALYWLTNFAGIHMFPTILVFLGMLPVYYLNFPGQHFNSLLFFAGVFIVVMAAIIELVADEQMRNFKKTASKTDFIDTGIWRYSRHPNYFGEISFWFGLWLVQMAICPQYYWTAIGFISMIFLFVFASIPMMEEKNRKNKPGYESYTRKVSMLIPWFRKN